MSARFDLHVHSAPCLLPRRADDVTTAAWYEQADFSGCVLKGHFESTVGRAAAVDRTSRVRVFGGIVLNAPHGGFNPAAVAAALALGARVVWMPTLDARASRGAGVPHPSVEGADAVYAAPPVDWSTEAVIRQILALVAEADAVLATGHLGAAEVAWILSAAKQAGVSRVLLTHATFAVPALSAKDARALVELGAYAEVTAWQLLHQDSCGAPRLASFVRDVGYRSCVLSSDAGQPETPPAPEALDLLVEALVAEGLDSSAVEAMASEIPERLVVP